MLSSRSLIVPLLLGAMLGACDRQSAPAGQANASASAAPTTGEVSADTAKGEQPAYRIDRRHKGEALPDFMFADAAGKDVNLTHFAGRPILVNLWATWCAPCIAEMPQLDAVAAAYARDKLAVLTISQDSQGAGTVLPFFKAKGFRHLQPWLDPENQFGFHYATGLLPTSVLYDAQGREVARVTGALDWTGEEATLLIDEAVNAG